MTLAVLLITAAVFLAVRSFRKPLYTFRAGAAYLVGLLQWLFAYTAIRRMATAPWGEFAFFKTSFPFFVLNPVSGMILMAAVFAVMSSLWYRFEKRNILHGGVSSLSVFLSLVQSTAVPVYIYSVYHADFAITLFLLGYVAVNLLFYIAKVWKFHIAVSFFIFALVLLLGISAFVGIVITPLSAFLAWFDLLKEAHAGGLVPLLFAVTGGAVTSVLGGLTYRHGHFGPFLGSVFVLLVLLSVIHQSALLVLFAVLVLVLSVVFLASRGSFQLASQSIQSVIFTVICAAVLAMPFGCTHKVQGIPFIDGFLSPVFKNATVSMFPNFPFLYNIEGYGYSFNQRNIGGKPALSKRAVFTVEAPRRSVLYLRTEGFDVYTGTGWVQSKVLSDAAVNNRNTQYFIPLRMASTYERKCSITVHTEFFDQLPHTLDAYTFSSMRSQIHTLKRGDVSIGFSPEKPLVKDDILNVYKNAGTAEGLTYRDSYLAVPGDIPLAIKALAERLGSGIEGEPWKILSNIETYLAQNYTYSLEVNYIPREAVDATWDFLFNSATGYCTHFATAYVLLARLNGIPARYVSGFLVYMPENKDRTVVTGLSAHAWPEVWIDGRGWTTKEATPPMNPDLRQSFLYYGNYLTGSSFTSRQLSAMLENTDVEFAEEEQKTMGDIPVYIGIALLIILFAAAAFFMVPKIVIRMPSPDPSVETKRLLKRIVRYYRIYGFEPPSIGGWEAWGRRIARGRADHERMVTRIARISSQFSYGKGEPQLRDRKYLKLFIRRGFR